MTADWLATLERVAGLLAEAKVRDAVAAELERGDRCGVGPLSKGEYRDDAVAILSIVREHVRGRGLLAEPQLDDGPYADLPAPDDGVDDDLWTTEEAIQRCPEVADDGQRCVYAAEHKGICSIYSPNDDRGWVFERLWAEPQVNPSEAKDGHAIDVVVYEDGVGQWHWRLVENGRTVEASKSRFVSKVGATAVAELHARNRAGLLAEGEESRKP